MTTSSSRDFNLDVAEAIEEAYERCGLEMRTGYDAKTARRSLNIMFSEWANRGLNLWTVEQTTQSLTSGTASYHIVKNAPIPAGGALKVVSGQKVVLNGDDQVRVYASASTCDVVCSILQDVA